MRRVPFAASLLVAGLLAGSCLGPDGPTGIGGNARAEISIAPALIPSPADAGALAIHRIRTVVRRVSDATVLGQSSVDVDPAAASWTLSLDVSLPSSPIDAMVTVVLLHVASGVESVEFSGVAGPLTLTAGTAPVRPDVQLVRGPLANVYTTGVTIPSSPDTLLEGGSVTLGAAATTSGSQPPTVFWTVLDSAVLSSAGDVVTGLAPGTGRVVASAGAFADTASIVVRPAPAVVEVTPDTVVVAGIGGQASFQAVVIDARGDTIVGEPIVWRSATASVVTSLGGGLFSAIGTGTGRVEAYGASDATVVGSAFVVVGGSGAARVDVDVNKTVNQPQPLAGARITFTVSAVNHGPGPATNVAVFDTLRRSAFTSPTHSVSTGSRVGDSLWIIPLLASGATATWTTDVTVASGVAGGSASNTAILRALAENDTTPANDTARVSINFPISAVPTVQITSPADSSVFDPGDPVTFVATASDPEDGNLTSSIQWRSSIDGALATGATFTTSTLRAGVHTISAAATDTNAGTGADTVRVTIALYTMPSTLNVPFGGTASLPITLSQPAPTGGVTLAVVSSVPSVTSPLAATVFIAAGALSGNATLRGLLPGSANITVSNPQYGAAVVVASVTAELDILNSSVSFATPFTETLTVQLESQGIAIAAPLGGLGVTLTSLNPTCVAVTSPITIPSGQTTRTASLSYGGTAPPPCQAYVRATSPGVVTDSVLVSVTPPPTITVNARTVGASLQEITSGSLGVSNHGGVTLTLTSSDSTVLRVSPDAATSGTRSINLQIPNGTGSYSLYVQGIEGATGSATVTATATGFNQGTGTMTVVQPGVILASFTTNTTTLSPDAHFYAYVGYPSGTSVNAQNVRAGSSGVVVTFGVDNLAVGRLTNGTVTGDTVTATILPGLYYTPTSVATGGVAFDPVGVGTATVTARAAGFIAQPIATQQVTVTAPTITMGARTVGGGLQENASGSLGATNHGGVALTLTSSDSTVLRVSPDASTAGTRSIAIPIANGTAGYSFYIQGIEGATGSATVTATATGFNQGAATMTVVQPGVILASFTTSTTTLSPDAHFYAYVGYPSGTSVNAQNVRAGSSGVVVTFAVDNLAVGRLTNGTIIGDTVTATIPPGLYYTPTSVATGGVAFDPVGVGTATVTARAAGFIAQPIATQQVTVTAPTITVGARTVGGGLQENASGSLGATNHGGVTLTLTSSDSTVLRVSPDASTAGTRSIAIPIANGTAGYSFYVQGIEGATGSASVTASAAGFNQGAATMTVVQPGIILASFTTSTTTLSPDAHFYAYVGYPSGTSVNAQNVRAGSPGVVVTFAVDNLGIGQLTNGTIIGDTVTATIPVGLYYTPTSVAAGGVAFDPVGVGTATVTARAAGFIAQPIATQQVTVTAPTITVGARTVGAGLQEITSGSLNATNHGGVTLTLTSSDSTTLVVSPNATTPGARSISLQIPNGTAGYSFYVQGIEGRAGSATVTAAANGFLDGTAVMTVVQPGIILVSVPASVAAGAADAHFYAYVGYPSGNSINAQNVRAGNPGVLVTATSTNLSAAQVRTPTASGASVTALIPPGLYYTPSSFATGGFVLDPVAAGQTTVGVSASGFISQPIATQLVTITP